MTSWTRSVALIGLALAATAAGGGPAYARTGFPRHGPTAVPSPPPLPPRMGPEVPLTAENTVLGYAPPPVLARAAYLIDMRSGATLYQKNADARLPMASTTKITTAVLVLEHANLHDLVTVSNNAATIGESTMGLQRGERLTVEQLLYGLLLNSGNDAAIALAEHVAGSETRFVAMMNGLASSLGMRNTHYVTPHGLDAPGHYSSARDLATIAMYAMHFPVFRTIVNTESYHIAATRHNHEHWLATVNMVKYWFPGVTGIKPGDTDAAGFCQVVSDARNGRRLLAVLLNTPTLVRDIRTLLDFGSRDFTWVGEGVYWDTPDYAIEGGSRAEPWRYYVGAGHYVRGLFLHYFDTHGGLRVLGYPRTEQLTEGGTVVQYFQAGILAYDPGHLSVYPEPITTVRVAGRTLSAVGAGRHVATAFAKLYRAVGGAGVLGPAVTSEVRAAGFHAQYFRYGALGAVAGNPYIIPLGDAVAMAHGWLPATGAADMYPGTIDPVLLRAGLVAYPGYLRG